MGDERHAGGDRCIFSVGTWDHYCIKPQRHCQRADCAEFEAIAHRDELQYKYGNYWNYKKSDCRDEVDGFVG